MGTTRRVRRTGWAWDTFAQRIATPRLRDLAQQTTLNNYEKAKKLHFLTEIRRAELAELVGADMVACAREVHDLFRAAR